VKHFSLAQLKGNGEKMKGLVEQVGAADTLTPQSK
jgi:hypothetical protein